MDYNDHPLWCIAVIEVESAVNHFVYKGMQSRQKKCKLTLLPCTVCMLNYWLLHWQLLVIVATQLYTELHSCSLPCGWTITLQVILYKCVVPENIHTSPVKDNPPLWKFQVSLIHFIKFVGLTETPPQGNFNPFSWGRGRGRNGYFARTAQCWFFLCVLQWLAISTITLGEPKHLRWRNMWTLTSSKERESKKIW